MSYQPTVSPQLRRRPDRMASYYNDAQKIPVTPGSASMTDDPSMTRDIQSAKRDRSLLIRQYNKLRRSGDYAGALGVSQQADNMGLPVGRPANDDQIRASGVARYYDDLRRTGGRPRPGGLAGADFRHSKDGGQGVGGYDFNQQGGASPLARRQDKTAGWRQAWQAAETPEEKDAVVERASRYGIPLSDAGRAALERRNGELPPPAKLGAVGEQGPAGAAVETQDHDLSTPDGRLANMKRQIAAGTYDQFTKPEVDREVRTERMFSRVADLGRGLRREFQREWREAGSRQMDEINRKSPGWDDPAAYAAARRAEVAGLQRKNLESVGKFQKGLKEEIVTGGNDKIPLIQIQKADGTRESIVDLVPEGKSRDILMDSIKKFGNLHKLTPKEAEEAAIAKVKASGEGLGLRVEYQGNKNVMRLY